MCIACELGYWMMIDALEAERASRDPNFSCEPEVAPDRAVEPKPEQATRPSDEMSQRRD